MLVKHWAGTLDAGALRATAEWRRAIRDDDEDAATAVQAGWRGHKARASRRPSADPGELPRPTTSGGRPTTSGGRPTTSGGDSGRPSCRLGANPNGKLPPLVASATISRQSGSQPSGAASRHSSSHPTAVSTTTQGFSQPGAVTLERLLPAGSRRPPMHPEDFQKVRGRHGPHLSLARCPRHTPAFARSSNVVRVSPSSSGDACHGCRPCPAIGCVGAVG